MYRDQVVDPTSRKRYGAMSNKPRPTSDPDEPSIYQIRLRGQLGEQWSDWFAGMTVTLADDGDTQLTGVVVDQAALYGLLKKVRDLGIPLISVTRLEPDQSDGSDADRLGGRA